MNLLSDIVLGKKIKEVISYSNPYVAEGGVLETWAYQIGIKTIILEDGTKIEADDAMDFPAMTIRKQILS